MVVPNSNGYLIKASNGASDFGNKFGQPLITGSVLTFEHEEDAHQIRFRQSDYASRWNRLRKIRTGNQKTPQTGDKIVILGGENYRIGMGAAVSSADTGALVQE
jgi:phosphoribosylformylglycinamidine synthase